MSRRRDKNASSHFRFMAVSIVLAVALYLGWNALEKNGLVPPQFSARIPVEQQINAGQATVSTRNGQSHVFNVEIADTPEKQADGLMFRQELGLGSGMLFVFKKEAVRGFWMQNTYIPLDLIFAARGGEIVHIHKSARPGSLDTISSVHPAQVVLEVNAGTADRLHIEVGDKLSHPSVN